MPSSADDALSRALDDALGRIVEGVRALGVPAPRVVIDGRSGSGKTTLAARLRGAWPLAGEPRVVALDDFYPGWGGLAAATAITADDILAPLASGRAGAFRRWDWVESVPDEHVEIAPDAALIIEGAGALSPRAAELADLTVWVDAPEHARRTRALERDGEAYAPHWEEWAAQERAHIALHRPAALASLVIELP